MWLYLSVYVTRDDDGSALLTARAVVNCSGDSGDIGWRTKIQDIVNNPVDASTDFVEVGRRIRGSVALQESMKTFCVATFGGQGNGSTSFL